MKHLAYLLGYGTNSQLYSSIYEDWRPKVIEDIAKSDGKESTKDSKFPGTSAGTRAAADPGPVPAGSPARFLGESQAGLCERPGACLDQRA